MIDEMMSYTIIESDGLKLEKVKTDMAKVVSDNSKLYKSAAKIKSIHLVFFTHNIDRSVLTDSDKIEQILGNLLSNVIIYPNSGGEVSVTVECHQIGLSDHLKIIVADNGIGNK